MMKLLQRMHMDCIGRRKGIIMAKKMEMTTEKFLDVLNSGKMVVAGAEVHLYMQRLSQEALKITAELNGGYHDEEEVREIFSRLIGRPVDKSFGLLGDGGNAFNKGMSGTAYAMRNGCLKT